MKVVINDANILIDLVKLQLLEKFIELEFELYTTDFILAELNELQRIPVEKLSQEGELTIITTTSEEDYESIFSLQANNSGVSFEDCSVWHYSNVLSGTLLTGDGKLRKQAKKHGLEVRGILYIFDQLLHQEIITFERALIELKKLLQFNNRLPQFEIEKRLVLWAERKPVREN